MNSGRITVPMMIEKKLICANLEMVPIMEKKNIRISLLLSPVY